MADQRPRWAPLWAGGGVSTGLCLVGFLSASLLVAGLLAANRRINQILNKHKDKS